MKHIDLWCALGVTFLVFAHHVIVNGFERFELHPAVVLLGLFFAVYGVYKLTFGKLFD